MKILVCFSGGKDSQAALILMAKKHGCENVEAVFCDTGWEHPFTREHVKDICRKMNVKLTILHSKEYVDFIDLAMHKKRFPSIKARFCTLELKVKPMIDYILELNTDVIVVQGIRAQESANRAERPVECMYFKEYFERKKRIIKGKKYDVRVASYRYKEVEQFCKEHDATTLLPIHDWTGQQVIDYILENDQQPNKLYSQGFSRVGCWPCVAARLGETKMILADPYRYHLIDDIELMLERTFFAPGYIPKSACRNGQFAFVSEVKEYLFSRNYDDKIIERDEDLSCFSQYKGLCE